MVCSRGESLTHHINEMKFFNLIAAAAAGSSLLALSSVSQVHAQQLPPLRQNMKYVEAHQTLLNSGWQMVGNNIMHCQRGNALKVGACNSGFTNVDICSTTGYCSYSWINAEGDGLRTTSFGGRNSYDGTLSGWKLR